MGADLSRMTERGALMSDPIAFGQRRPAPPERPLMGKTILLVEDSRLAAEAVRLMCRASGARLRRADTLAAAHRHLVSYCPDVVLVDMGLPDGNGADLIAQIAAAHPEVPVIAISGDPDALDDARAQGAMLVIAKPLCGLAAFQSALLSVLPGHLSTPRFRVVDGTEVAPDPAALRDDLVHAERILMADDREHLFARTGYLAQFLRSLSQSADDPTLADLANQVEGGGDAPSKAVAQRALRARIDALPSLPLREVAAREAR